MDAAIRVHDLWKEYRIGGPTRRHDTFYDALGAALRSPVAALRQRATRTLGEDRLWALREVGFELAPG